MFEFHPVLLGIRNGCPLRDKFQLSKISFMPHYKGASDNSILEDAG
jgi:hypothetical protein